ncbi:very-long-chain enoyl-CoA reductase isoform X7 [Calonectris borealis]|uniref:very-long-chain enoyl-CoA reductase isoform X7 n=1 Tax=Calonectris borealis TaxID=1323832 RepID=UPI003F4C08F6
MEGAGLPREGGQVSPSPILGLWHQAPPAKKTKKAVLFFEVEILDARTREKLCFLDKVEPHATVAEIKGLFTKAHPQWYPARQSLRLDPKGRSLKDEDVLQSLPVGTTATFYFRDLGAQISWVTVFLTEYAGPLLIYLLFYFRVPFLYGPRYDFTASRHPVVHLACGCHSFHYVKRLLETLFVHRFSHGTMPLRNIFKNCTYYWGFAAWMAYYINHPLYTPPVLPTGQLLHPCGPAEPAPRRLQDTEDPVPHPQPLHLALPARLLPQLHLRVALFSLVGFVQMAIWAQGKHRSYLREFRDYPPLRSPIVPFLL